jgi:AcrR family transcriptional regulator
MIRASGRRGVPSAEPKTKRPGRPEGGTGQMRIDILDAAETIFSNQGYAGTTLREISDRAGVTQGLISYYFKSKFELFSETFLRRAEVISTQRIERLKALQEGGQSPSVAAIVEAFLAPILALRTSAQGRAYLRLHARLHTEPPNLSYDLRKNAYDVSTNLYAEALHAALPHLSRSDIYWRMTLMIGTYLYALSDTHRMDELMAESYDPEDADKLMAETVAFITSGLSRS